MLLSGQRSLPLPLVLRLGLPLSLLEGLLTPRLRGHAPPLPALFKPPALLLIQRLAIGACGLLCRACRLHRLAVAPRLHRRAVAARLHRLAIAARLTESEVRPGR